MIKILILTDRMTLWRDLIIKIMHVDKVCVHKDSIIISNRMFYFLIRNSLRESERGAVYAHCILDKDIDEETLYRVLRPSIKQTISHYGLCSMFEN